jgi:hypothetical protein
MEDTPDIRRTYTRGTLDTRTDLSRPSARADAWGIFRLAAAE